MELLIGWVVLAIVVGAVASAAGRGGFGYFVLSLLLSPVLGLLVLIIMAVAKPVLPESADKRPRIPCPQCAEMVLPQALRCPHCGFEVAAHLQEAARQKQEQQDQRRRERAAAAEARGERAAGSLRRWLGLD